MQKNEREREREGVCITSACGQIAHTETKSAPPWHICDSFI